MAPKPIVIKITGNADSLEKELGKARQQLDKLESTVDKSSSSSKRLSAAWDEAGGRLKDFASNFTSKLGPASGAADKAIGGIVDRIGSMGPAATAALGGVAVLGAGLAKLAVDGVQTFVELGEKTKAFQEASGVTAEQASVLVDSFDDLGIGADVGASAMARLSKTATTNRDDLEQLGVQVQLNKDGSLDLWGTLGNVADAMANSSDQAKVAAIGNAAFGKSWAALMPLLEDGKVGIEDAVKEAERLGIVMSQKDVDAAHELKMSMVDLKDSADGLKLSVGRELVPGLTNLAQGATAVSTAVDGAARHTGSFGDQVKAFAFGPLGILGKALGDSGSKTDDLAKKTEALNAAGRGLVTVSEDQAESLDAATVAAAADAVEQDRLKAATDRTTEAIRRAEQADRDRKQAQDDLTNAVRESADVELNYERAERSTIKALDDQHTAETDLAVAVRDHGASSDEAKAASNTLADQTISTKEAILRQSEAAAASAQHNAELAGSSLDAGQKALVQRDFLSQLAGTLEPGSPLRAWLDAYIGQLNSIPAAKTTTVTIEKHYVDVGGVVDTGGVALASGGPLRRGQLALVGEEGPELVVPTADSTVLPAGQTKSIMSGSGASGPAQVGIGGGGPVINISGVIGDKDAVIRWVHEGLRSYDAARRR